MAELKYLDLQGLQTFWDQAVIKIDDKDAKVKGDLLGSDLSTPGSLTIYGLKKAIDSISAGELSILPATDTKVGGILSGKYITVDETGNAIVNNAATADKLTTPITISLTGAITGFVSNVDGYTNISIETKASHTHQISEVVNLENTLSGKVNTTGQTGLVDLSGATVRVKTITETEAQGDSLGTLAASIQFVKDVVASKIGSSQAMIYKGTIAKVEDLVALDSTAKIGWTYIVDAPADPGTLDFTTITNVTSPDGNKIAKTGDMLICLVDGSEETAATWDLIKHNDAGQVYGPKESVDGRIAVFDGATGRAIKLGTKSIEDIESAIVANSIKSIVVNTNGDTMGAHTFANNILTINLPVYALGSKIGAGITGTVQEYVDTSVANAKITKEGVITNVGDDGEETISIADNVITLTLKNYALSSAVTTLGARVTANETLLAGEWEDKTVKVYVDDKFATYDTAISKINDKLVGVNTTVGDLIDTKIQTAIDEGGNIAAAIDAKIADGVNDGGVIDNAIDAVIASVVGKTTGFATVGDDAYIPTVALTEDEILTVFD